MSARRSEASDNLLLVAAAAIFVLTAQRYFQTITTPEPAREPAIAPPHSFVPELAQHGRGRRSSSPFEIPFAGWKDILWRTWQQIDEERLLATAAGVVFFGLLAVFPAITALVSSYGTVRGCFHHRRQSADMAMIAAAGLVPDRAGPDRAGARRGRDRARAATFLFGLGLAIWSANAGVKAVIEALNVVYGEREKGGFFRLNLLSLAFTTGAIIALMLMVSAVVALPLALDHLGLAQESKIIVSLARWPVMFAILLLALGIYRFGPSRRAARWEWLASARWPRPCCGSPAPRCCHGTSRTSEISDATYGSLGAAIGLMMWMWMSAIIVLCGAELNSEIEHQTARDSTVGPPKPLRARGAVMADTLGPAVP